MHKIILHTKPSPSIINQAMHTCTHAPVAGTVWWMWQENRAVWPCKSCALAPSVCRTGRERARTWWDPARRCPPCASSFCHRSVQKNTPRCAWCVVFNIEHVIQRIGAHEIKLLSDNHYWKISVWELYSQANRHVSTQPCNAHDYRDSRPGNFWIFDIFEFLSSVTYLTTFLTPMTFFLTLRVLVTHFDPRRWHVSVSIKIWLSVAYQAN